MQTQEFTLPNGGTPAAGQPDTGIFVLLNGEPLAGPIQEQHARIRTTINLPGGRSRVECDFNTTGSSRSTRMVIRSR